jgi:hypothetical protein
MKVPNMRGETPWFSFKKQTLDLEDSDIRVK